MLSSEKAMAPYSSSLAWKIPWTAEPGGLQSMGSQSGTRLKRLRACACAHTHTHTHTLLGSMGTELRDRPPGWSGGGSVSRTRGQL